MGAMFALTAIALFIFTTRQPKPVAQEALGRVPRRILDAEGNYAAMINGA